MNEGILRNFTWPLLITIVVAIGAFSGAFDSEAEEAVETALKRSLVTFGIARSLNAVISVAQGTEVSVTPLGMGLTLAPGEVLDPLNDLVERFSGFMLVSSVALGTQRVLIEISSWLPYSIFLVALGFSSLVLRSFGAQSISEWRHYLWRGFVVLAMVRFVVPIAVVGSEWMYSSFLEAQHVEAEQGISEASSRVRTINAERGAEIPEESVQGSWEKLKEWAAGVKIKAASAVQLERYSEAMKETAKDTVELIVVFFLSTFIFPIAIAIALWRLAKWALARPTIKDND
ncbi:hypothetical protein PVT68_06130 [Microbulbifer bruguierae]|uniref:Uncharacterized protein n=1 Tax=Microbulbifer bruguierae TaxID=3029061 RepID=A0ABY8NG16_9GAMM|nr:hypothetical protein [Microbulbifer bruguierae]WGL17871.1 hypothetical protein PVT68_06130 [Microbulbifer bruguierae]